MEKQNKNDNAANRKSYIGYIYNLGEKVEKNSILDQLNPEWKRLHNEGYIHIHDLDAYGLTYNCLTFDILNAFPYAQFEDYTNEQKIVCVFDFAKELLAKVGNEQSGGMSFANFDGDFAEIFTNLGVNYKEYQEVFKASILSFILWANNMHTRMGQTSYYVTLCVGLGTTDFARFITSTILDCFYNSGNLVYKPNIVFKVAAGINRYKEDKNYDLFCKALNCTSKKMIPTYLLCDCNADKHCDPRNLSIMGCRTRVVDDIFGKQGAIGRSNIDNISINLPRLALETVTDSKTSLDGKIENFKSKFTQVASTTKDILLDRYERTCKADINLFPINLKYRLMCEDISKRGLREVFKHGTLSIGFIGLSEAIEILTGEKYWSSEKNYNIAINFVKFMKNYVDSLKTQYNLNFSLLATSGEFISGRFADIDLKLFNNKVSKKGFYTNSFHVEVDSGLSAYKKIQYEGKFHNYTNGGCITYVELREAPLSNVEGLMELVEIAIKSDVHYLGFNFPKDICNQCGATGTFDECPACGSKDITRIRRVSGYLEVQKYFASGKMNESKMRKAN